MSGPQVPATPEVRSAIEALIAEFSWRIDHDNGRGVEDLFAEDGVYALGSAAQLTGRAEIAEFYRRRRDAGPRTSRHLFTNLHFQPLDAARLRATCVLSLHAADGHPPFALSPVMVADYRDEYVSHGGAWLFGRRDVSVVFGALPHLIGGRS
jgi:hypothetical protein